MRHRRAAHGFPLPISGTDPPVCFLFLPKPRREAITALYAVQGGIYRPILGPINHMAANIRYAIPEKWLICKGEDVFDESGPGFRQWPALARLLVERKEFHHGGENVGARMAVGPDNVRIRAFRGKIA